MFIIITRFSVFSKQLCSTFLTAKKFSFDDYSKIILDEQRLKLRFNYFTYTIDYIKSKFDKYKILHIIVTSSLIPDWLKLKFNELAQSKIFNIFYVDPDQDISYEGIVKKFFIQMIDNYKINKDLIPFCSIRLDDDDLLCDNFFDNLQCYINYNFLNYCISYPLGYNGLINDNKIVKIQEFYYPMIAIGLAYIGCYSTLKKDFITQYVFPPGSHHTVDRRVKTVIDSTSHSYIRGISFTNDVLSNDRMYKRITNKYFFQGKDINPEKIKNFSFYKNLFNISTTLIIITYHNTFFNISSSKLVQTKFIGNLQFYLENESVYCVYNSQYINGLDRLCNITISNKKEPLFKLIKNKDDTFSFSYSNLFLCAKKDNDFMLVNRIDRHEKFNIIF